jgi:hypothetical protein
MDTHALIKHNAQISLITARAGDTLGSLALVERLSTEVRMPGQDATG